MGRWTNNITDYISNNLIFVLRVLCETMFWCLNPLKSLVMDWMEPFSDWRVCALVGYPNPCSMCGCHWWSIIAKNNTKAFQLHVLFSFDFQLYLTVIVFTQAFFTVSDLTVKSYDHCVLLVVISMDQTKNRRILSYRHDCIWTLKSSFTGLT